MVSSYLGIVKISDPTQVKARATAAGQSKTHDGAIYCSIPELGLDGGNLVYCRYGLSLPYIKPQVGWKMWLEPTIGEDERWVYKGIADCGSSSNGPVTGDLLKILFGATEPKIDVTTSKFTIQFSTTSKIEMSASSILLTLGSTTVELDGSKVKLNGTAFEVSV